ncbi:iron-containing redox enzyme family protein [Microcoleus sp. FACHB-53]|nr:iron-containing redox enzyme family protein [Microcoleus sp. FACHB-53]MBD2126000.1 iron-containing redox enzyme family protein [Microcoleus sp. FACHB-1]
MQWLLDLAQEYRNNLRSGLFYKALGGATTPADIRGWVRQLYYQSHNFTSLTLPLRHAMCREPQFKACFAKHAMEEDNHFQQLVDWMRQQEFLKPDESPLTVPATQETLALKAYCLRSILCESNAHQIITMNLISEGVSYDFFSAVIPKLKELGLPVGRYWQIHSEVDLHHLAMGLDLIEQCEKDSARGMVYARIAWEVATLYGQMLDSWSGLSSPGKIEPPVFAPELSRC